MTAEIIGSGARRAPLQELLRALFERGRFAPQVCKSLAGEMERAGQQDRRRFRPGDLQRLSDGRSDGVGESWSNARKDCCQVLRIGGAFGPNLWEQDVIGNRRECLADSSQI